MLDNQDSRYRLGAEKGSAEKDARKRRGKGARKRGDVQLISQMIMMPHLQSLICLALTPGLFAGFAISLSVAKWNLPVWAIVAVGFGGWTLGFLVAAAGVTLVELCRRQRK